MAELAIIGTLAALGSLAVIWHARRSLSEGDFVGSVHEGIFAFGLVIALTCIPAAISLA